MTPMDLSAVAPAAPDTASNADPHAVERAKVKELAQQFESMLIGNMLREMRKTLLTSDDEEKQGLGSDVMTDTIDTQLGDALAKGGGLGLQSILVNAFNRTLSTNTTPRATAASAAAVSVPGPASDSDAHVSLSPEPSAAPEAGAPVSLSGTVTSAFGWRRDPFNGTPKFHKGIDLRAAYGSDVRADGGGTVAFAGEQRGYGLTLVIDHGNGLQTRYAHLSATTVRAGETVGSGQLVAQTGNSGRSTAPHLHVELLKDGQAVDPSTLIKGVGDTADF
jgi:murein DD-endopeptidase MepM/ murein hydrolase activator NlpD